MKTSLKVVSVYVLYALIATISATPFGAVNTEDAHEPAAEVNHAKSKTYFLKCIHEQCSLIESDPHAVVVNAEKNVSETFVIQTNKQYKMIVILL
jgi:hypothetical protein